MKVRVGDKTYNSDEVSIVLDLTLEDKKYIGEMKEEEYKYGSFPDKTKWGEMKKAFEMKVVTKEDIKKEQDRIETIVPFKLYKRTGLAEIRNYILGESLEEIGISVSDVDNPKRDQGKIGRNLKNHLDQWYIARKYFNENFEEATTEDVKGVSRLDKIKDYLLERLKVLSEAQKTERSKYYKTYGWGQIELIKTILWDYFGIEVRTDT